MLNNLAAVVLVLVSSANCSNSNCEKKILIKAIKSSKPTITEALALDSSFNTKKAEVINNYFKNRFKLGQFSGAILFYANGQHYSNCYGYANTKLKTKLNTEQSFQIASVSKTLTSIAILSLISQKKIELNTKVHTILPGFPYKQVNLAQLLSHKSGVPNYMNFAENYFKSKQRHLTNDEVLNMLIRHKPLLEFKPDSRYKYSNTNYVLLAIIIERLTKIPFEKYMNDSVFGKIGMNNSYIFTSKMTLKNQVVQGHNGNSIFPFHYQDGTMGDKGVYTTVFDLLKFDQALRQNIFISDTAFDDACTPHTLCRPTKDYYGYGWRIKFYENKDTIVYHNGWWHGFKAYFVRWKNKDQCIIVLANTARGGFIKQEDLMRLMEGINPKDLKNKADNDD